MAENNCPVIPYGIPATGAIEYSLQSGRELFRCGRGCIKMFITNVMVENTLIKFTCDEINDASDIDNVCLQSLNGNWKDKMVINWIGKEGATTEQPSGTVINRVSDCTPTNGIAGSNGKIYTHTEGTVGVKAQFNISLWETGAQANADAIILKAVQKLDNIAEAMGITSRLASFDRILSDISTNVSQTDWQGGGCNYQLFMTRAADASNENGFRISFNYQNGQAEVGRSCTVYDEEPNVAMLTTVIANLLGTDKCSFQDIEA